jgi:23S rRNA (pseudouridine1915-N3)-methyltransferase
MSVIRIIAGGKKHASWLAEACAEYEKRLRKPWAIEWQFVDEEKLDERVARLKPDDFMVLLDENGQILSSPDLCQKLKAPLETGRDVVIVIGGAFGHFSPDILSRANLIWSLSKLVFPHQICRLIVTEQIYRAQEIYLGHAYHHE